MSAWTFDNIPDQTDRVAIVTGANTGIGFETARALVRKGAHVILACRDPKKGHDAVERINSEKRFGKAELRPLDLADLDSVRDFAEIFRKSFKRLDLLIQNAGVMVPPKSRTKQGFELQFGTNFLGPFALGAQLMPLLESTASSRIVVVYSGTYRAGAIDFADPNYKTRAYSAERAYCQSKLADVLYAVELQKRLGAGSNPIVTAGHPGWTATDLQRTAPMTRFLNNFFAMSAQNGALPTLRAATDPDAAPGSFFGPSRFFEMNGPPVPGYIAPFAKDPETAARLFDLAEQLTGVRYELSHRSAA